MMKQLILIVILLCNFSSSIFAQQPPTRAQINQAINAVSEEEIMNELKKAGIDPNSVNISQEELLQALMQRGVNFGNPDEVKRVALEIVKQRIEQQAKTTPTPAPTKQEEPEPTPPEKDALVEEVKEEVVAETTTQINQIKEEIVGETAKEIAQNKIDEAKELKEGAIYGHSFINNGALRVLVNPKNVLPKENYIIGAGDIFSVNIFSSSVDYSSTLKVSTEGHVSIAQVLPRTYVKGLTYKKATRILQDRLSRVFSTSRNTVDITLNYSRTVTVNIFGEVNKPAAYTLPAANTAYNALSSSGGVTKLASVRNIELRRSGSPAKRIDIYKYINDPTIGEELYIQEGDFITVPTTGKIVSLSGAVKRPHNYELIEGESLNDLIEYAGGLSASALKTSLVVRRYKETGIEQIIVNFNRNKNFQLKNGDQITVRTLETEKRNEVYISGAVRYDGEYPITQNTRILDIINLAILEKEAKLDTIYVIRDDEDKISKKYIPIQLQALLKNPSSSKNLVLQDNDEIEIYRKDKFVTKEILNVEITGSIRNPRKVLFDKNLSIKQLIYLAGGLERSASKHAYLIRTRDDNSKEYLKLDLENILSEKGEFSVQLRPLDVVRIIDQKPFLDYYNVSITGDVRKSISTPYDTSLTVKDMILFANGLQETAYNNAYIISTKPNGKKEYRKIDITNFMDENADVNKIEIKPRDQIKVFSSTIFEDKDLTVTVTGAVRSPGKYEYSESFTLEDALFFSGGLKLEAASGRVEISRLLIKEGVPTEVIVATVDVDRMGQIESGNDFKLQPYDQIMVRRSPQFELQQNITINGEVNYPGVYPIIGTNERLNSFVKRAGGFTDEAFLSGAKLQRKEFGLGKVVIDLEDILDNPDSRYNYILKEGDVITIPKSNELVSIKGLVDYPDINTIGQISVPYHKYRRAKYYVNEYAGGIDREKEGSSNEITVEYPSGEVKRTINLGLFKIYPKVKKGSIITVGRKPIKSEEEEKEKKEIDWESVISRSLAQITAVVTLYVLLQQVSN